MTDWGWATPDITTKWMTRPSAGDCDATSGTMGLRR